MDTNIDFDLPNFAADRAAAIAAARALAARKPLTLDTETTGFGDDDQIVEISVVDWDGQALFQSRVKPTIPIPAEASRYNGIHDADLAGCPTFAEIWPALKAVLSGRALVSYNLEYDTRMIYQSLRAHSLSDRLELAHEQAGCIMTMFAAYYGEWSDYHGNYRYQKLAYAARYFDLPAWQEHGSLADAQAARQVLAELAKALEA